MHLKTNEELQAQIQLLQNIIVKKDAQLRDQGAQLEEKDAQLREKDAQLREKDAQLKSQNDALQKDLIVLKAIKKAAAQDQR